MNAEAPITCSNPDCEIATSGKCVEAFTDPKECPHFDKEVKQPVSPADTNEETPKTDISVRSGNALRNEEAGLILCNRSARVISIIGPQEAGKTTLISALYDVFQHGPFREFAFVASNSLNAYEERCHRARAASKETKPDTEHTLLTMGLVFMHLTITNEQGEKFDLLFSDRSGEDYEAAMNHKESCLELIEVSRSDLVLILVDGERIATPELRHKSIADIKRLIEALIDANMIGESHRVALVLTKYDEMYAEEQLNQDAIDAFEGLVAHAETNLSTRVNEFMVFKIAARPKDTSMPPGTGLNEIFQACVKQPSIKKTLLTAEYKPIRSYHAHQYLNRETN